MESGRCLGSGGLVLLTAVEGVARLGAKEEVG